MNSNKVKIGAWIVLTLLVLLILVSGFSLKANAATTASVKHNATGFLPYTGNPMSYKEGNVIAAAVLDKGLVLRIQPRGTYSLFTEDILFCSASVEKLIGKENPVVLTYETVAHTMVEGIGCHTLVSVDEVKTTKGE